METLLCTRCLGHQDLLVWVLSPAGAHRLVDLGESLSVSGVNGVFFLPEVPLNSGGLCSMERPGLLLPRWLLSW